MTGHEQVDASQVMHDFGQDIGVKGPRGLPPLQQAAFWLTVGVGGLIIGVVLFVGVNWELEMRSLPSEPTGVTAAVSSGSTNQTAFDSYREMSDLVTTRALQPFDDIVVRALLPVFTTLLGYLFGRHVSALDEGSQ